MFETKRFLKENFKTPQGLLAFLRAYKAPLPGLKAVEKWFQRESIPADWLPILLGYLELDNGGPVSVVGYMARGNAQ